MVLAPTQVHALRTSVSAARAGNLSNSIEKMIEKSGIFILIANCEMSLK